LVDGVWCELSFVGAAGATGVIRAEESMRDSSESGVARSGWERLWLLLTD